VQVHGLGMDSDIINRYVLPFIKRKKYGVYKLVDIKLEKWTIINYDVRIIKIMFRFLNRVYLIQTKIYNDSTLMIIA